jgi:hypothetical protein
MDGHGLMVAFMLCGQNFPDIRSREPSIIPVTFNLGLGQVPELWVTVPGGCGCSSSSQKISLKKSVIFSLGAIHFPDFSQTIRLIFTQNTPEWLKMTMG